MNGRPYRRNKTAFLNFFGVVWKADQILVLLYGFKTMHLMWTRKRHKNDASVTIKRLRILKLKREKLYWRNCRSLCNGNDYYAGYNNSPWPKFWCVFFWSWSNLSKPTSSVFKNHDKRLCSRSVCFFIREGTTSDPTTRYDGYRYDWRLADVHVNVYCIDGITLEFAYSVVEDNSIRNISYF